MWKSDDFLERLVHLKRGLKSAGILNITSLATAFTVSLFLSLFIMSELGWDEEWSESQNIYRLESAYRFGGQEFNPTSAVSAAAVAALKESIPEVERAAAMYTRKLPVRLDDKVFSETVMIAQPEFLDIFKLDFIAGSAETALPDPSSVIISETAALKYFGDSDPMGQVLTMSDDNEFRVTGVFRDLPQNTHLDGHFIAAMDENALSAWFGRWYWTNVYVYTRLSPDANVAAINAAFPDFIDQYHMSEVRDIIKIDIPPHNIARYWLLPITDIHLYGASGQAIKDRGNPQLLSGLAIISAIILAVAVINYINLASARGLLRTREVGIRKTLGGSQAQLQRMFLSESFVATFLSMVIGLAALEFLLPYSESFLQRELDTSILYSFDGISQLILGSIAVATVSGFYPAMVLSHARPSDVLFSNRSTSHGKSPLRSLLVMFQFAMAVTLIMATCVIYLQTQFTRDFDLGFQKQNKVLLSGIGGDSVKERLPSLEATFRNIPGVTGVTYSLRVPGDEGNWGESFESTGDEPTKYAMTMQFGSPSFLELYGAQLLAGRLLSPDISSDFARLPGEDWHDEVNVVVNETAARTLGFGSPQDAIGSRYRTSLAQGERTWATIVGVIADMHFRSLRSDVRPTAFAIDERNVSYMTIGFAGSVTPNQLAMVQEAWREVIPQRPIALSFLDEYVDALYINENRAYALFIGGAILAIFVACVGLYGLALFVAQQRTREIGIRKVMGARVRDIVSLLVWQFSKPVLLANLIGLPLAAIAMNRWLESFVYRIDISAGIYIVAAGMTVVIAWLTIGSHAVNAARTKPINTLREQ